MQIAFDQEGPEGEPFEVPEGRLIGHLAPAPGARHALDPLIEAALADPLDAPRLDEAARRAERVLILVDDGTRNTPVARLLPHIARQLEAAGVKDDQVTLLVALGTHRPMRREELVEKLGEACVDRWRLVQHDMQDRDQMVRLGTTEGGMPIVINRLVPEHDLVIGIGSVRPHGIMGYSGGAKIAMIGAAGAETESWTHWHAATRHETHELLGVVDNPLRKNLEEGAREAGLDAVLNVVLDDDGHVQKAAYGEPVSVLHALIPTVHELYRVDVPQRADIVVVEAAPADRDYWQSVKGLYAAELLVRDGGTIILVARNPEGVADNHPIVRERAAESYPEIVHSVEEGDVHDVIGAAVTAYTARLRRHAHIFAVSSGMSSDDARALGFEPVKNVQEALDRAVGGVGASPRVAVLSHGAELLPVVEAVNDGIVTLPSSGDPLTTTGTGRGRE